MHQQRLNLNKIFSHPLVFLLIRLSVGGVFLAFGIIKAIEPKSSFFKSISDYHMLPASLISTFAIVVIALEIIFSILFITGIFTRVGAWGITTLLVMFIVAISQAIVRGLELTDCGCSGSRIHIGDTPQQVLLRDGLMLLALLWFLWGRKKTARWTLDQWLER